MSEPFQDLMCYLRRRDDDGLCSDMDLARQVGFPSLGSVCAGLEVNHSPLLGSELAKRHIRDRAWEVREPPLANAMRGIMDINESDGDSLGLASMLRPLIEKLL